MALNTIKQTIYYVLFHAIIGSIEAILSNQDLIKYIKITQVIMR